jgi:hypothetical protein
MAGVALSGLVLMGAARAAGAAAARDHGAGSAGGSGAAVEYHVSAAAQRAALAYWTPARMAAAQAEALPQSAELPDVSATPFTGVPTVGALFATGSKSHFCTASVVDSTVGDLLLAAAHCVWGSKPSTNIVYVPEYRNGQRPYNTWAIQNIYVAPGWASRHDPNLDFAFLAVTPPAKDSPQIQTVTGGLRLGVLLAPAQNIEVIGYNDNSQKEPVECKTRSSKFRSNQMKFTCNDYYDGTSGGPWIIGYNAKTGTGTVFGVIGGYEQGGDSPSVSYSSYFGLATRSVFEAAEQAQS